MKHKLRIVSASNEYNLTRNYETMIDTIINHEHGAIERVSDCVIPDNNDKYLINYFIFIYYTTEF